MNKEKWLMKQLQFLKNRGYKVQYDGRLMKISGSELGGPGWTDAAGKRVRNYSILIDLPPDFPVTCPGADHKHSPYGIHLPAIYHNGKPLDRVHECVHRPWRWMCFGHIDWDPDRGNLVTLLQIIEASVAERGR